MPPRHSSGEFTRPAGGDRLSSFHLRGKNLTTISHRHVRRLPVIRGQRSLPPHWHTSCTSPSLSCRGIRRDLSPEGGLLMADSIQDKLKKAGNTVSEKATEAKNWVEEKTEEASDWTKQKMH